MQPQQQYQQQQQQYSSNKLEQKSILAWEALRCRQQLFSLIPVQRMGDIAGDCRVTARTVAT